MGDGRTKGKKSFILGNKLSSRLYEYYRIHLFPKIREIRGASFLRDNLREAALNGVDRMEEPEATIIDEDWDILVVLDACRYDEFKKITGVDNSRISCGSATVEWVYNCFNQGAHDDIIYISGNPQLSKSRLEENIGRDPFHNVVDVWHEKWDDELGTVLPQDVTNAALKTNLPEDKRMIVHYLQPHLPFVPGKNNLEVEAGDIDDKSVKLAKMSEEEMKKKYRNNLVTVLEEVGRLVEKCEGNIVITSDHGEAFGENAIYTHPAGVRIEELVKLPKAIVGEDISELDLRNID